MTFSAVQNELLEQKLDPKFVVKPSGKFGPKGDYIEGWHAIAEANRIFGFDGWSYSIIGLSMVGEPTKNDNGNFSVSYICTLSVEAGGVVRQDVGYGSGHSKQVGDAVEGATKEAVTDALKRCLRTFGWPFGLALYDKKQQNVGDPNAPAPLTKDEARTVYAVLEMTLKNSADLTADQLQKWATEEAGNIRRLPPDWQSTFRKDYIEILNEKRAQEQEAA